MAQMAPMAMHMDVPLARKKLDAAIALHQGHLDDPGSVTVASMREEMTLIMDAREALGEGDMASTGRSSSVECRCVSCEVNRY